MTSRRLALSTCCTMLVLVGLLAGCSSQPGAVPPKSSSPHPATTQVAATAPTSSVPPQPRVDDGSLGSQSVRKACSLLTGPEIKAQLGGPVGPATPAYPYCEWLVGKRSFLALDYEPGVPFSVSTHWTGTLQSVSGLGTQAVMGDNHYLYFSSGPNSFWLLWQKVGEPTAVHLAQLVALAHDVLSHPIPAGPLAPLPAVPPGPPIYFAGDSTAAGPEWAWVTYHVNSASLGTLTEYQVGSGLVVPAYFDWPRHLLAVTAEERPKLVIYMGSANDGQELPSGNGYAAVGSAAWRRIYGERVGATMSELTREGAKVLWIGEPAMQSPLLSRYMLAMDQVCRAEAAAHPGVTFFNPGSVLNRPGWKYTGTVLLHGKEVGVRLDGIHLNIAGSLYLADKIAPIIRRILKSS